MSYRETEVQVPLSEILGQSLSTEQDSLDSR